MTRMLVTVLLASMVLPPYVNAAPVAADGQAPPVALQACAYIHGDAANRRIAEDDEGVTAAYRNQAAAALTRVTVGAVVGGVVVETIDADDRVEPGARGEHNFIVEHAISPLAHIPSCRIAAARFADGSSWADPSIALTSEAVQTPDAPVDVRQCRIAMSQFGDFPSIAATFAVRGTAAATSVDFSLFSGGLRVTTFTRRGNFVPGAGIDGHYEITRAQLPLPDLHLRCRVDRVTFASGRTWTNPAWPAYPYDTPQTPGSRLDVMRCRTFPQAPRSGWDANGMPFISVDVRNTAPSSATRIDFAFAMPSGEMGGGTVHGTFAPGAVVHDLEVYDPGLPRRLETTLPACAVRYVEYADGTSWSAPGSDVRIRTAPGGAAPPVSLLSCEVVRAPFPQWKLPTDRQGMVVRYRNDAAAAIASLSVGLVMDGRVVATADTDDGAPPHATAERLVLLPTSIVPISGPATCTATAARFTDGTTWGDASTVPTSGAPPVQTPGAPLAVRACDITSRPYPQRSGAELTEQLRSGAGATAVRVDFSLRAGGRRVMTFARDVPVVPGESSADVHPVDAAIFPLRDAHLQCRIDRVTFADGSAWRNPAVSQPPADTAQTPGARIGVLWCATYPDTAVKPHFGADLMYVRFRDDAPVAASVVYFSFVAAGRSVGRATARGAWTPGRVNDVTLGAYLAPPLRTALPSCIVERVEYADGSSWQPGNDAR